MGRALVLAALLFAACKSEEDEKPLADGGGVGGGGAAPAPVVPAPVGARHFDFNNDGFDDAVVGAPAVGPTAQGTVFIYFGSATRLGAVASTAANVTIIGEAAGDAFGASVADAGDVNGDGIDDLIVGAPTNDALGADTGRAYVFFGTATPAAGIAAGAANVIITGQAAGHRFGESVSSAGNVNAGGFDDVIIGAPAVGRAYLFLGTAAFVGALGGGAATTIFTGEAAGDLFGRSVSLADDWNSDGFGDMIVGAPTLGRAYLFFGSAAPPAATAAAAANVILTGEAGRAQFGFSVSNAGNVNADGFADVIVGCPAGGGVNGRAYIFFGRTPAPAGIAAAAADVILDGESTVDRFGFSVATAGDINNDGFAEVIVGAPFDATTIGRAYLLFGAGTLVGTIGIPGPAVVMSGEGVNDQFGLSVAQLGDFNGDGFGDVIVGADFSMLLAGRAYVDLGLPGVVFAAAAADVTFIGPLVGDQFGTSVD